MIVPAARRMRGGMLGVMDEFFLPATRHTAEEIVDKQNGRIDLSVGGGGWIDLDSGRVQLPTPGSGCRNTPSVSGRTDVRSSRR